MKRNWMMGLGLSCVVALSASAALAGSDRSKGTRLSGAEACKVARGSARTAGAGLHLTHCFATLRDTSGQIHVQTAKPSRAGTFKSTRGAFRAGRSGPLALGPDERGALRVELTPRSAALKISW